MNGLAFFIVHVENQAQAQKGFGRRLFKYFARLHEKYNLPVYPIAVLSFASPRRPQARVYRVNFPNRRVLTFEYDVIQLNRLNWRAFIKKPNPVAAALMVKMNIAPKDRPRVKWECLRLLTTLKLDKARSKLISGFVDTYLRLDAREQWEFEEKARASGLEEKEEVMEIITSWKEEGIKEGIKEGLRKGRAQGLKKGRLNGIREGRIEASQDALIEVLESRFKRIPVALRREIESIEKPQRLKSLLREATVVASLKKFEGRLG